MSVKQGQTADRSSKERLPFKDSRVGRATRGPRDALALNIKEIPP